MVNFRVVISDPAEGKAYQLELDEGTSKSLFGVTIGDTIDGTKIGLDGYSLLVTGGTDRNGFPMRRDLPGSFKKKVLLTRGVGYREREDGKRYRKMIRGNTISEAISQINTKVVSYGSKPLVECLTQPQR
ncbi:MAG: 30S ribosomal protein S6e [Candidatus Syntropharchaeales archaeon]|nr:30S ribosomal protein S6e [Candidatus Syntrophoarchaeum sp.]RKY55611.1 MAG: 30S ribosomal protein S6e [Candidatus Neomarinimicrobiota bacterium]